MLSTIVCCENGLPTSPSGSDLAVTLARTLACLVTANVEGLIADVRIAGPSGQDLTLLARHAGCDLSEADNEPDWLRLALEAARGPDVFLLRCGRAPEAGFIEEAGDFLAHHGKGTARAACVRAVPESFFERLFPSLAPVAGLIATRDRMLGAPRSGFARLARFVVPAATFRARARRIL